MYTGASTGDLLDDALARANAVLPFIMVRGNYDNRLKKTPLVAENITNTPQPYYLILKNDKVIRLVSCCKLLLLKVFCLKNRAKIKLLAQ